MRRLSTLAGLIALSANAGAFAAAPPAPPVTTPPAPKAAEPAPHLLSIADIDNAQLVAPPAGGANPPPPRVDAAPDPAIVKSEVLLSRLRFSPGVIDGRDGSNFHHALAAFAKARGLQATDSLSPEVWRALTTDPAANRPVASTYTLTAGDVAGPFAADVGEDFVKLAALPGGPQFTSAREALAERFHMSEALLTTLNPGVDFKSAGARITVVDAQAPKFQKGDVAAIEVTKNKAQAEAFDKQGRLVAFYPATVGSTDRPSPSGVHKVVGVAEATRYVYDPRKLHWGPRSHGKLVIKPGPNGPVGTVWIALNAPSYGIHGTPTPDTIGKTGSHGCVRLTNWDAEALAAGVKPGVKVTFEGERS